MSACEKAGRWEKAVELLYEARNVIGLTDNAYLWTTAIRFETSPMICLSVSVTCDN